MVREDNESCGPTTMRFGDFELTKHPMALFNGGQPVELSAQPLKLLSMLVERQGGLVGHKEIRDSLWKDRTVDFSRSIHVCIRQIRAALSDDATAPRFIENVPRQGYRFIAAVELDTPGKRFSILGKEKGRNRSWGYNALAYVGLAVIAITIAAAIISHNTLPNGPIIGDEERVEADDSYRRGVYLLDQREQEATKKSLQYFDAALAANPMLAEAHLGAARALGRMQRFDEAKRRARRALTIDAELSSAYLLLGLINLTHDWDWDSSLSNLRKALELDPENIRAHQVIAVYYVIIGDLETAISHMVIARKIDPASTIIQADFGWYHLFAGNYSEAATICGQALDLEPENLEIRHCLIRALSLAGSYPLAFNHMIAYMQSSGAAEPDIRILILGKSEDRLSIFDKWRFEKVLNGMGSPADKAFAAAAAGDFDATLVYATQAVNRRDPMAPFFGVDPVFRPLLREPEFQELLTQIGVIEKSDG